MGRGKRLSVCFRSFQRTVTPDAPTPAGFLTQLPLLDDRHQSLSMSSVSPASTCLQTLWNYKCAACSHRCSVEKNECFCQVMHVSDMNISASHRPPFSDSVSPASDCNRGSQGSLHLLCLSQSWNHWIQVSVFSVSTLNLCVPLRHKNLIKWIL